MKKVFLVEPDNLIRIAFEKTLEEGPWDIYTLDSMEEFDFRCKDFDPNLVIFSSNVFTKECVPQLNDLDSEIPVAILGFPNEIDALSGISFKYHRFEKPFKTSELTEILDRLLNL